MYPGTACNRPIPVKETKIIGFRETEEGKNSSAPALMIPGANISETDSEYLIEMATPGLHRDDFSIEINQSVLTISAKKESPPPAAANDRCEYDYTHWTRAFSLPEDADAILANALYKNGELVIRIPRSNQCENKGKIIIYVY
jgi:HSP20 family protein